MLALTTLVEILDIQRSYEKFVVYLGRQPERHRMKGFIILVASIAVAAIFASQFLESPQERECGSRDAAYAAIKESIEGRLKAPSTADWPSRNDSKVLVAKSDSGECSYEAWGYVDAENGFGAMIRSEYYTEIWYSKDDMRWITTRIDM